MKLFKSFKKKITTISIIDHWEAPHYPQRDSHEVENRAKIKKIAGDLIIELSTLSDVKNYNFIVKSLNRMKNDLQSIIDGFRNHTERDHFANFHHLFGNVYSMKEIILENIPTNLEKDYMYFQVNSFLEEVNFKLQLVNHVIENIEKHSDSALKDTATEDFSALEWATIFYYAYESKLLHKTKTKKDAIQQFIEAHKIDKTFNSIKNNISEAKIMINVNHKFPIKKLEKIIPFMQENYPQTVTKIKNDIEFLEEEQSNNE